MNVAALVPEFSAAHELGVIMHDWEQQPAETLDQLRELERDIYDRRKTLPKDAYDAARDALKGSCDRIKGVVDTIYKTDFDISWRFGLLLSTLGQDQEALNYIDAAISLRPNDPIPYRKKARMLSIMGRKDKSILPQAIEAAEMACQLEPNAKSYKILGETLFEAGEYEEAKTAFIKGADAPNSAEDEPGGYLERRAAEIYRRHLDEPECALTCAKRAYEIEPSNRRNVEELAYTYDDLGKPHQAIPLLMYAHALKPNFRMTLLKLTEALTATGQAEQALFYAGRLETAGDVRDISLRKKIEIHRKLNLVSNETLEIAAALVSEYPDNLRGTEEAARLYVEQKMYTEAIPLLEKLIGAGVRNTRTLSNMLGEARLEVADEEPDRATALHCRI